MTFPAAAVRKLARSEEMFAQSRTFVGATVQLDGPVDVEAMTVAFDALLQAHPVLAGHLERGDDGLHHIVADDFMHPGIWLNDKRTRLDQGVALANLRVRSDSERATATAEVTLYTHHSLADAHHQFRLIEELFTFYAEVVATGTTSPVIGTPAPEPLEVLLEERGIGKQQRSGLEPLMAAMFAYELPPSVRAHAGGNPPRPAPVPVARFELTEAETVALSEFCADHRLSVHSFVSAAILLAEWQFRNTPDIPVPYLYPVDLRFLLTPPVAATEATNPLGVAGYLAAITADTDIVDLAREIIETFRADLADGVTQQSLLHFNLQYEGSPPGMPELVMSTDGGTIPALPTPPGVSVVGVQTEMFTASEAGVDLYAFLVFADRLQIEHHAHAPAPEATMAAIRGLLSAVPREDDWMSE